MLAEPLPVLRSAMPGACPFFDINRVPLRLFGADALSGTMAFVVVGSGAAGISAAEKLRQLGKEVVLVSRWTKAYSLCSLPYMLSGEVQEKRVFTHDRKAFEAMGIRPVLGKEARSIDVEGRTLLMDDGQRISYDALLVATGSVPFVPPGLSCGSSGVFSFNSIEDTRRLMDASRSARNALVNGAGFSGLECAYALRKRGLDVSVVEMEDRVLPRILDRDMSPPVEELLADNGVKVHLRTRVKGITGDGGRASVHLSSDKGEEAVRTDLVVLCLGVRPDIPLSRSAGLRTNRGIVVGSDMQSSVPGIYAAGDVAEFEDAIPATWLTAAIQGSVAASNMAGRKATFTHLSQVNIATLFGVPVVGIGTPATYSKEPHESRIWKEGSIWRKLITVGGKAAGYQAVGDLKVRGMVSLLSKELQPLQDAFARWGLHHPALSCPSALGLRPGPVRASGHTRKPRGAR